jgi:hypothetical protein
MAKDLVAKSDRVVEQATFGVKINCLLVEIDRLICVAYAKVKIANAIVERDVALLVGRTRRVKNLLILLERFVVLLFLLEFRGLFLQLCEIGHLFR